MNRRAVVVGAILVAAVMVCPPTPNLLPTASSQDTEGGVLASLKWLARHQDPDGHWGVTSYTKQCKKGDSCGPNLGDERYDTAATGLSLLAFLGAGYYYGSKDTYEGICFGDVVRKGLKWLIDKQDAEGCFGIPRRGECMDNHLIAGLALSEAYALTGSDLFKAPVQKAVDFAVAAQNDDGGWGYGPKDGKSNGATAIWGVMLLKSAELSGRAFPAKNFQKGMEFFVSIAGEDGKTGYGKNVEGSHRNDAGGGYKLSPKPGARKFASHETMTAAMMAAVIFVGKTRTVKHVTKGSQHLLADLPVWKDGAIDYHYWYFATLTLFQYDGPNGEAWKRWSAPLKEALIKNQNPKATGCKYGSWEPVDRWSRVGGRVYATAINQISLLVYYRYASVFGGKQ